MSRQVMDSMQETQPAVSVNGHESERHPGSTPGTIGAA
jgi:hypothetical protein